MSFGIDYIEYDDSYFPTFWNTKKLEMLTLKKKDYYTISDFIYEIEGVKMVIIFEFTL
jgi:hypothetical protein